MKPLPTQFTKNNYTHQLAREGDIALFQRTNLKAVTPPHFEVIRVQRHNGLLFPGQTEKSAPAEFYPSIGTWGHLGWTFSGDGCKERAERWFKELTIDPAFT